MFLKEILISYVIVGWSLLRSFFYEKKAQATGFSTIIILLAFKKIILVLTAIIQGFIGEFKKSILVLAAVFKFEGACHSKHEIKCLEIHSKH